MEKYIKALHVIRDIWNLHKADQELKESTLRQLRSMNEDKLEGLKLVAMSDNNLTLEDFREILNWKLEDDEDA